MKALKLDNYKYSGIDINAEFEPAINVLSGNSSTGKTLLMHAIENYCERSNDVGMSCRYFNSKDRKLSEEKILSIAEDFDIILFDNADLYMTRHIIDELKKTDKIVIMSIKIIFGLGLTREPEYLLSYKNKKLKAVRF